MKWNDIPHNEQIVAVDHGHCRAGGIPRLRIVGDFRHVIVSVRLIKSRPWLGPVPAACQDWANTKAAYRFFANPSVTEREILAGHFAATKSRMAAVDGRILVLHDTTAFSCPRDEASDLGELNHFRSRRGQNIETKAMRGILMHSSLVITPKGLPLGLTALKFWTRRESKGCNALKRKINPTRVPIAEKESYRWLENLRQATALAAQPGHCVHLGDRASDLDELFCTAAELQTHFLVRTCVDRLAGEGGQTIATAMKRAPVQGRHRIEFKNAKRVNCQAVLEIKFQQMAVHPPMGKRSQYPTLALTVIHAHERGTVSDRPSASFISRRANSQNPAGGLYRREPALF